MNKLTKSKARMIVSFGAILLAITLMAGSMAYLLMDGPPLPFLQKAESSEAPGEEPPPAEEEPGEDPEGEEALPTFSPQEPDPAPVHFNKPSEMRGVYLVPGADFIKSKDTSEAALRGEIDAAIQSAKKLTMNTVIIDTVYADRVIYQTKDSPELSSSFDLMEYIVAQCRANGLYTYAIFDTSFYGEAVSSSSLLAVGAGTINKLSANLQEFAEKYQVDGILLDGYLNREAEGSYSVYLLLGGSIGYDNFMRLSSETVLQTASKTIRRYAPGTQVGLLADAVWANSTEEEEGSATQAAFTALGSGNADTKAFVEQGLFDFVAVKAYASLTDAAEPFEEVVSWWSALALENDIPLYAVHASGKICTSEAGWEPHDQITKQVILAKEIIGYCGSIFNDLSRLAENPKDAAATLVKYYNNEVQPEHILTELQITKPERATFTTQEPVVIFTGASDPNSDVTINGDVIETDASGYFTVTRDLKGGLNTFVIVHKEKTITYNITREILILKEVSPTGSITTEGGMDITISAVAYEDAAVSATINGKTVNMVIDDTVEDEADRDSNYKRFVGTYTAPAATSAEQNLGNIVVYATWQGESMSLQGASVKVNKKAKIEDGVPIVITASQAKTYPPNTLNNIPTANCYPLPAGAMDYAVGDEIIYKNGSKTYSYYVLASGLRVASGDMQAISNDYPSDNAIKGMSVRAEGGFTYVTLSTAQKVSYTFKYNGDSVSIQFHNTVTVPGNMTLDSNPLFTAAKWNDSTLTLSFVKSGGFMGYKGYFDDSGNLVFRFNHPPGSISSARVAIDPGHGGKDQGAAGFLSNYPEKVINLAIAQMLADELESRGATVLLLDNSNGKELEARVKEAENFNADLYISVHNNTAARSSAVGTEVYYFYPYARSFATTAAKNVSSALNTTNRGSKYSYYTVTLSPQFPSILAECGFITNKNEYEKLIKASNQQRIASALADAVESAISSARTGSSATGEQSTGSVSSSGSSSSSSSSSSSGGEIVFNNNGSAGTDTETAKVTGVDLSRDELTLTVGETYTLDYFLEPDDADNQSVTWKSSNTSVAKVSDSGKITAVKSGTATITVTTDDGGRTASCKVTVEDEEDGISLAKAKNVEFSLEEVTIKVNSSRTLEITSNAGIVKNSDFTWKSSASSIASVDSSGKVSARKEGTATITATGKSGSVIIRCTVHTTTQKIPVESVTLDQDSIELVKGTSVTLKATISPSNATNRQVTWTCGNERVASVSTSGKVTGINAGTTVVTARADDGKITARCSVTVVRGTAAEEILLNFEELELEVGDKDTLIAEVLPDDTADKGVTWKSSDTSVVKVDSNGKLTALKAGTATITATSSSNSKVTAKCKVTVLSP